MNTFIDYPIYGNEEEMAIVRTGEIVKANRKIGYRRRLTKNAKKDFQWEAFIHIQGLLFLL